jgi:hypothetical protein
MVRLFAKECNRVVLSFALLPDINDLLMTMLICPPMSCVHSKSIDSSGTGRISSRFEYADMRYAKDRKVTTVFRGCCETFTVPLLAED